MSYGVDVAVSDIPANLLPALEDKDFYPVGDVDALAALLQRKLDNNATPRVYDLSPYNWDNIARQTVELYQRVLNHT